MPTYNGTGTPETSSLTNPADLLMLFGRYFASLVLLVSTLVHLFQRNIVGAAFTGAASLFLLWTTFRLWRRLRDERMAAKAARDATSGLAPEEAVP